MNKFINRYNENLKLKLRRLNSSNPKDYWKFINRIGEQKTKITPEMESLVNHLQSINLDDSHDTDDKEILLQVNINDNNVTLNSRITKTEIEKCIKSLKNGKAAGTDKVLNEYIKFSKHKLLHVYELIFNTILETGIIPSQWTQGNIIPIYKNKGDPKVPDNYRPITLLSCVSKLFTAVLNSRLNAFLDENSLLQENQAGFRRQYSTIDHIFTLHSLSEILKHKKKKLFCIFIDFSKAFDSVWRVGLWRKLLNYNIGGKFLRLVVNLYKDIKSCVTLNNIQSNFFESNCGVRQGENLSPILFSLFLNDLDDYLISKGNSGVKVESTNKSIEILSMLYADDSILISDDPAKLQKTLNDFSSYCSLWKLNINASKTKALIFGGKHNSKSKFTIGNKPIETVDSYKYLGTLFSKSGKFLKARKHIMQQAKKALFLFYKRIYNLSLPIDLIFKLFDNTITPILCYSSEVWGHEDANLLERVHTDFLRRLFGLRKSTPLYMLYGETGRHSLQLTIKNRMIGYWLRLVTGKESKLSFQIYTHMLKLDGFNSKWIAKIKNILVESGRNYIWLNQNELQNIKQLKYQIKQTLYDQDKQNWHSSLQTSSKGKNYAAFKDELKCEDYLLMLRKQHFTALIKLRTRNTFFPIEVGGWSGISLSERVCTLCDLGDVGDEFHYLLKCPFFQNQRKMYLDKYYYKRPNMIKFKELLQLQNTSKLSRLCSFAKLLIKAVKPSGN